MTSFLTAVFSVALLFATCQAHAAQNLHVAVAASLAAPMQRIAVLYEQKTGEKVMLSLGSTGRLFAQASNGAPFDALLTADNTTAAKLIDAKLAKMGSTKAFAQGRLVLWSKQRGVVDDQGAVLTANRYKRLAIADPKLAPYGAAAMATLSALGLRDLAAAKLVQGESIAQAYQFVASGNAELGLLALSQVWFDGNLTEGSSWLVPEALHPPLLHEALVLNGKSQTAGRFVDFLLSEPAQHVLRQHGYTKP